MQRRILLMLMACAALVAQSPKVKAWVGVQPSARETRESRSFEAAEPIQFRIPLFLQKAERGAKKDRTPGAVVEVWGDASWARQDEFKAFVRANLPSFRTAFDTGLGSSTAAQFVYEMTAHPEDLHRSPAFSAPRVWSNSVNPWVRDRRFY